MGHGGGETWAQGWEAGSCSTEDGLRTSGSVLSVSLPPFFTVPI